jgi:hypothetical protein
MFLQENLMASLNPFRGPLQGAADITAQASQGVNDIVRKQAQEDLNKKTEEENARKEREAISLLTSRPGRLGTILTSVTGPGGTRSGYTQ